MTATPSRAALPAQADVPQTSELRRAWRKFARDPVTIGALVIFVMIVAAALTAPWIMPHDPMDVQPENKLIPPAWNAKGSLKHLLGTDALGRDVLSRVIFGARVALLVSVSSVVVSAVIGVVVGLVAGYFGGRLDGLLMTVVDVLLAFPFFLLALAVAAVMGTGLWKLVAVIGLTGWTEYARVVRGETMVLREKDYVTAARATGGTNFRLTFKHVLPNCLASIVVISTLALGRVILLESGLSYLGVGVPSSMPGWGLMLADSLNYTIRAPWLGIWPGFAIVLTVLSSNVVGDRVRDVLDPRVD